MEFCQSKCVIAHWILSGLDRNSVSLLFSGFYQHLKGVLSVHFTVIKVLSVYFYIRI
jgi:hypothetical protein